MPAPSPSDLPTSADTVWNYTRDSQPRLDAAHQRHRHLRVIELRTRRSMDEFLETI